jgi:hypothetical protein
MHIPAVVPALNTNLIVIAILVGMGLYGLMAGKMRLRILILSVYVGVVVAEQMKGAVRPMLHMLSDGQVSWLLLAVPIVIFGVLGGSIHKGEKGVAVANMIVAILTGGLIISSALHLLPTSEMKDIDDASFIAMILQQYHLWLLGLLPLVALVLGFFKPREKKH